MSYYHLFVKKRCPHCKEAVKTLAANKLEHVISSMDKAPSALAQLKESTNHKTVPIVYKVENNLYTFIGGCDDLKGSLENGTDSQENETQTQEEVQE